MLLLMGFAAVSRSQKKGRELLCKFRRVRCRLGYNYSSWLQIDTEGVLAPHGHIT